MSAPVRIDNTSDKLHAGRRHPNELDLRRIARILAKRSRYRYVAASVIPVDFGYLVTSPCCSRSISDAGQAIDIALIQYDESASVWLLFNKVHEQNEWLLQIRTPNLHSMLDHLNDDPHKQFWQ